MQLLIQVTPEAKKKAAEAKSRGDEAFKRQEFDIAVDAYTQVPYLGISSIIWWAMLFITSYLQPITNLCVNFKTCRLWHRVHVAFHVNL